MMDKRDAMKAAVEALETAQSWQEYADEEEREQVRAALSLLRAALEAREPRPVALNGIPATDFHGEGAIARCSYCGRYSLDRKTLGEDRYQPVCECGEKHGWSGSFKKPGPGARWSGRAPEKLAASPVAAPVEARESASALLLPSLTEAHEAIQAAGRNYGEVGTRDCDIAAHNEKMDRALLAINTLINKPLYASPVAAEGDAQLLDWLETHPHMSLTRRLHGKQQTLQWAMRNDGETWGRWHETIRDALRAAMKEQPSDGAAGQGASGVEAAPAPDQYGIALATMPKTPDEVAWLKPCALGACPQPEVCGKRGSCAERGGQQ